MATLRVTLSAIITLLAGVLILAWPKMFRILLGVYLIVIGILQLVDF